MDHSQSQRPPRSTPRRTWLRQAGQTALGLGSFALLGSVHAADSDEPSALERIRTRGHLTVGLYNDLPPFHLQGRGIEVEMARALARSLGVALKMLPFPADDNMNDDLRNMVWRGHYLGYGPADVLLHVPVDRPLMQANPRVEIFGPYWRERVMIARNLELLPELDSLEPLRRHRTAVAGLSLGGWLMLGADGGALREQLITKVGNGVEACEMLRRGEVAAACGLRSELESTLGGDARYAITRLPTPRAPRDGWAVGMAVKREAQDLAQALQAALEQMSQSGEVRQLFAQGRLDWQRV
ncbi:amino acid ABC transporter substrate-binding protein (PAAT family) [Sphaerotilus hippei]|uniref:Amino acid ABC transporter substrate-binding protein (PAAT family) n=1 Tax=Sphaerotilus hippei TaxID=744406 RepID=A0A318H7Z6_9BURK|nr:transporter substrate-binding domain-containing protein [Sphaerotilus hippei]PXW98794.1 amino acid ABC transporter substrate-binding protein (PAAT family) [Sphaerotilus hippei]